MKKLLLLFLLVAGGVSTASARKIYINVSDPGWWANDYTVTAISFDGGTTKNNMAAVHMYGKRFRVADIPNAVTECKIYRHTYQSGGEGSAAFYNEQIILLPGTADIYKSVNGETVSDFSTSDNFKWQHMICRNNIKNNWDHTSDNMTSVDNNTLTYTLTKSEIEEYANYSTEGIRFRLRNGDYVHYNDAGDGIFDYPQIYPNSTEENSNGKLLSIAGNTTGYYHNLTSTDWYWQINIPSYDYEKIVITAKYVNESGYKWKISADAYISKTANGTNAGASLGYSTFGAETDVDLSSLPSGVTAETATVDAYGKITYNSATELAAGEGVLLTNTTGANVALSIPVKASAEAVAGNALRRVANEALAQGDATYWHYILTKNTVPNNNADLGWYLVNEKGSDNLTIGTAYLQVAKITPSRGFYPLWSEDVTAIEKLTPAQSEGVVYDLQGRKVAQPTKGLYIVNGKKVIMK